jgi:lysophospholipase L1-like esterase
MRVAILVGAAILTLGCEGPGPVDEPAFETWPDSMAAIGDSITQASFPAAHLLQPLNPAHSWATGDDPDSPVDSHYRRIRAENPAIDGNALNAAVPGAQIGDAAGQVEQAVAHGADYVTFLLGANDVCAGTPPEQFADLAQAALRQLANGLPEADILVVSIPDVTRLWDLFEDDARTRVVWRLARVCPAVLGDAASDADRDAARETTAAYNALLQSACAAIERCVHDDGAVFADRFTAEDVSPVDYFHPSLSGQARLAEMTWRVLEEGAAVSASAGRDGQAPLALPTGRPR